MSIAPVGQPILEGLTIRCCKLRWYQYLLHLDRARKLRSKLLRCGDSRLILIDVPWVGVI